VTSFVCVFVTSQVVFYSPINTAISILCVCFLLDTTTSFCCPHQPSSVRALVHEKSRRKRETYLLFSFCVPTVVEDMSLTSRDNLRWTDALPDDGWCGQPRHV